jgi:N-acetylglucosamine-6-sulfatase
VRILAAILVWLCLVASAYAQQPNIVVIMTDDDNLAGLPHQPKIQALMAAKGVSFTTTYAATPTCCPDRTSFLTGQYSHTHGVRTNNLPDGGWIKFKDRGYEGNNLAKWLKDVGYKTALFGKYLNEYTQTGGKPPYWDNFQAFTANNQGYYNQSINVNGQNVYRSGNKASDHSTDWFGNRAVSFVRNNAADEAPFFLFYAPIAPHGVQPSPQYPAPAPRHKNTPVPTFVPPPNYAPGFYTLPQTRTLWTQRLRTMLSVGDKVEELIAAVSAVGKLNNTYFVYLTDNGWCMGEGGEYRKGMPRECSSRIYMIIRGPGIPEGETRAKLVSLLDLPATICELAGCTPGVAQEGKSLMPLIANPAAPWRSTLLFEWQNPDPKLKYKAIRFGDLKYVKRATGVELLYDLAADPWETSNKVNNPAYAAQLSDMRERYDVLKDCAGSDCWME